MSNSELGPKDDIESEDSVWDKEESKIVYAYPLPFSAAEAGEELAFDIPQDQLIKNGPFIIAPSPESHHDQFRWAEDFLVKDGTPILASQEGIVTAIVEVNDKWGPDQEFAGFLNYITVQHQQEGVIEYSQYCHLKKNSRRK